MYLNKAIYKLLAIQNVFVLTINPYFLGTKISWKVKNVETTAMRRQLLHEDKKPCLKIGITLAVFKLSWNMPCFKWQVYDISAVEIFQNNFKRINKWAALLRTSWDVKTDVFSL